MSNQVFNRSIITDYNDSLKRVIEEGVKTDATLALYNQTLNFDVTDLNTPDSVLLFLPFNRGRLNSSIVYGISEALWYRTRSRKTNFISHYAKMWNHMADEQGLINSNYFYQLYHNNDIDLFLKDVKDFVAQKEIKTTKFSRSLFIASKENQHSSNDMVCNNKLTFNLSIAQNGEIDITCDILARSIDLMFGLPYDLFTFHGISAMLKEYILDVIDYKRKVIVSNIKFSVINLHLYLSDYEKHFKIHSSDTSSKKSTHGLEYLNDEIITLDNRYTPYSLSLTEEKVKYLIDLGVDELVKYSDRIRNIALVNSRSFDSGKIKGCNDHKRSYFSRVNQYKCKFDDLDKAIDFLKSFKCSVDESISEERIKNIKQRLISNKWDRKTMIMSDRHLCYLMYNGNQYVMTFEEH